MTQQILFWKKIMFRLHTNIVQNVSSGPKAITRDVPQGGLLGPVIFILFNKDLST